MKTIGTALITIFLSLVLFSSCEKDYNLDENGRLITDNKECYISTFDLLGSDHRTVLVGAAQVDTVAQTITAMAKGGTNLLHVKPYCSAAIDACISPAMGGWTDFSQPREYTVISGDKSVRKTYKVTITLQK